MGEPGCVGSGIREEPRSALAARRVLDRASGPLPVRRPLRPGFPARPPDDPAAEALSPVPQWPDNRLIVPVEGNGYMTMLERWEKERRASRGPGGAAASRASRNGTPAGAPLHLPPPSSAPSPFRAGAGAPRPPAAGSRASSDRVHCTWQSVATTNAAPVPPAAVGSRSKRDAKSGHEFRDKRGRFDADSRSGRTFWENQSHHPPSTSGVKFLASGKQSCQGSYGWGCPADLPAGSATQWRIPPRRFRARRPAVLTSIQDGQSFPWIQARRNLAWRTRCVSA